MLTYLLGFPMSDVHTLQKKQEVLPPVNLYTQVTYSRVWKKTKETQIKEDMESELTT